VTNKGTIGIWALGLALAATGARAQATSRAKGTFDIKMTPAAEAEKATLASGRFTSDKKFQGDLVGTSKGEMWTVETSVKGSAGYVAIEKVSGTLRGRTGGFTLLHHGTMARGGDYKLTLVVVPDSGTGELAGIGGRMSITITDGKHFYEFEYTLPEKP
jgi:uncharacterized protein DUF3224